MAEEFRLPGSSYEELVKIIQAYGEVNEPTSIDDLHKLCGVNVSQISRNSGFLLAVQVIEGGKAKKGTDKGKQLARAMGFNKIDEIAKVWREIVTETDFLSKMVTAIKIRKGMDLQSFLSHIAYSSGQSNNQFTKAGAGAIVEILKIANFIEEVDGKLVEKEPTNPEEHLTRIDDQSEPQFINTVKTDKEVIISTVKTSSGISINIDIKVVAKVSDLDDLGIKLKKLLSDINEDRVTDN